MPNRRKPHPRSVPEPVSEPDAMLDLSQFSSLENAFERVEPGDRYKEIGMLLHPLDGPLPMTLTTLFWFSMITRSEGLHGAIAREIRRENPHAVFPLIRAFTESVVVVLYVYDHPKYIHVLADRPSKLPRDGPKRKSIQALINYASSQAPGMKTVYAELSEATHFGSTAMWASHRIEGGEDSGRTSWSSYPRWKTEGQALIACAQTLELADAMDIVLRNFCSRYIMPRESSG